jgi:outer membrane protein
MMANKITILTVLFLMLFSGTISAQKLWTLEECINHAMKNNLQIRQTENNLKISNENLLQSKAATLPSINGSGTHNYNFGRNIDPFTNQYTNQAVQSNNFSLNSSLVLFNGLQVRNAIQQSKYDYMASTYQLETLKNDISLNISAAYLDILFNKELVVNATNQLVLTKQQYTRSVRLVEAGTLSQNILFDLKSQMAQEEANLIRNKNNLTLSYLNLSQYLDLPPNDEFDLVRPESIVISIDSSTLNNTDEIVKTALSQQPQIKSYEYRRLSSLEALNIARGRQSPRLSLNATLSTLYSSTSKRLVGKSDPTIQYIGYTQSTLDPVFTSYSQNIYEQKPYGAQLKDNYNRFVGLTLTIPILNGLQVKTSISRAKLNVENAELDLQISKMNMEKVIRKAAVDAQAALSNYKASSNSVKASEEALKNSEKRLDVGLINSFEYNQSKTMLANTQSDLLRAKYDYIFKLKVMDFYRGIPLKL